jgi:hypothetical protein
MICVLRLLLAVRERDNLLYIYMEQSQGHV